MHAPPAPEGATLFGWFWDVAQEAELHPDHLAVIYPEQIDQFACNQCAQCCQQPWNIQVDQDYYQRWYATFDQHPSGRFKNPFFYPKEGGNAALSKQPGSHRCLFLDEDQLCFIHKTYGSEAKPEICQRYPHEASLHGNLYSPSLKSSCRTAATLLSETGELVLRMVKRPEQFPQQQDEPLQPWLGLLLEGLWQHSISPVRCLAGSRLGLAAWDDAPEILQDWPSLETLYHRQVQFWRQDNGPKAVRMQECLSFFQALNPFPSQGLAEFLGQWQGQAAPFPIRAEENAHLAAVLRNYLTRRLLNLNPLQVKGLNLVQFTLLQAFTLQAVQLKALCLAWYAERRLTPEILVTAINQVETAVLQNPGWFDQHQLERWDTPTCLDALRAATQLDLCLPEAV